MGGYKSQAVALESVLLDGGKRIFECSSKTCNEAVRRDLGLDTLQGCKDKAKLKWWYKLVTMPEDRYPKSCLVRTGTSSHIEVDRGRFGALVLDKAELEDIQEGSSLLRSERISEYTCTDCYHLVSVRNPWTELRVE